MNIGMNCLDKAGYNSEKCRSSHQWIFDELKRLDIIIRLYLLSSEKNRQGNVFEHLKGVPVSRESIIQLLSGNAAGCDMSNEDVRALSEELEQLGRSIDMKWEEDRKNGVILPLAYLSNLFKLTFFERFCIIVSLSLELDSKYGRIFAFLQDDVGKKRPSLELVMNLLRLTGEERINARKYFAPDSPLAKYILKTDQQSNEITPLISKPMKLDEGVVDYLLGFDFNGGGMWYFTVFKENFLQDSRELNVVNKSISEGIGKRILGFIKPYLLHENSRKNVGIYIYGPEGAGRKFYAEKICSCLNLPLISVDSRRLMNNGHVLVENLRKVVREGMLRQAALLFEDFDFIMENGDRSDSAAAVFAEEILAVSALTFMTGQVSWKPSRQMDNLVFSATELKYPDVADCHGLWESMGKDYEISGDVDFVELAGKFRLTPGKIRDVLYTAHYASRFEEPEKGTIAMKDLYMACREHSTVRLGTLAKKLSPKAGFSDIVLPSEQTEQLAEILKRVKNRNTVYIEWGFDRKLSLGKGVNALFSGPPGTGKTLAAEIIAKELQLDIYKIDLSQIVSKYIGETEKNLKEVFTQAAYSNSILLFDEADAILGKRTEVKDAHDRYANLEIAFLLQQMDEYDGLTILTTNMKNNIDEAFIRRMQFVVDFPFPDEVYRKGIWQIVFPGEMPRSEDINVDFLARKFQTAGGNIKNMALSAAFYAAEEGCSVNMRHILLAAKRELQKSGKVFNRQDMGEYGHML